MTPAPEFALSIFGAPQFTGPGRSAREPTMTQRRILERLALTPQHPVRLEQLIDAVWEDDPPHHARAAIQNQISRIRATWGEEVIATSPGGYSLGVTTDAWRLQELSSRAEVLLEQGDALAAFDMAESVVPLWVGRPFTAIEHVDGVAAIRRSLSASCKGAENTRLAAGIALGRGVWAVAEAERLVAETPLDEHRQAMLARALATAGRRGDALAALATARRRVRRELGIDPGPLLNRAEAEVLGARASTRPGTRQRQGATGPAPAPDRQLLLPFVGRVDLVRVVLSRLATRRRVLLAGEPGIGLTRVLDVLGGHLGDLGTRVLRIDAADHLDTSVGALVEILEGLDQDVPAVSVVPSFVPRVRAAAAGRPVAVLLDDAHLLGRTARTALLGAAGVDVVVVLAGQGGDWVAADDEHVWLPPLTLEDVAELVRSVGREHDDAATAARLHAASGGNPLALSLLLGGGDPAGVAPLGLHDLARTLIAGLGPRERALAERVAVAGDDLDVPAGEWIPDPLVRDVDGRVRFRHGVLREVLYRDMPPARREELHLEVAHACRAEGAPAGVVARHLLAAGPLADDVVATLREAAAQATRMGAHADAAGWLEPALARASGQEELTLRIAWGDALRLAGDSRHLDVLLAAAEDALEADEATLSAACHALLQLGGTSASGVSSPAVSSLLERALGRLHEPALRAPVCAAASQAWALTGEADRSRAMFEDAVALDVDDAVRAAVLPLAYMALGMPGDLERREAYARELIELGDRLEGAGTSFEGWQLLATAQLQRGDGQGARASVTRMAGLAERAGDVGRRWSLLFTQACIAHLDGREEDAELLSRQGAELFTPVSPTRAAAVALAHRFALLLSRGDPVTGAVAQLAGELRDVVATQPGVPAWRAAMALAIAAEDPRDAIANVALAWSQAQPDVTWLAGHAIGARAVAAVVAAAARSGGAPDVEPLIEPLVESVARELLERLWPWRGLVVWQGASCYGPVDTSIGLLELVLGQGEAAQESFRRAERVARGLGAPAFGRQARELAAAVTQSVRPSA